MLPKSPASYKAFLFLLYDGGSMSDCKLLSRGFFINDHSLRIDEIEDERIKLCTNVRDDAKYGRIIIYTIWKCSSIFKLIFSPKMSLAPSRLAF